MDIATTGLPMVFAVWGGRKECVTPDLAQPFLESCRFGLAHWRISSAWSPVRVALPEQLVREYFARNVTLELGDQEYRGLRLFLRQVCEFGMLEPTGVASA